MCARTYLCDALRGDGPLPAILAFVADQGLFRVGIELMYGLGLRSLYFPGINHIEANIDTGTMGALDMSHLDDKALFLSRLYRKPKLSPGKWHREIQECVKVFTC